ncbi:MAG TPA: sialidase family protein [Pyrinomonadaceae bacterium]|nr:sialidase family protein [Pyrinomonadaceae bacterium]
MWIGSLKRRFLVSILSPVLLIVSANGRLHAQQTPAETTTRIRVGPNVLVSRERDGTSGELMVAVDPTNPNNLLGSGILFRTNHPQRHPGGSQESRGYRSRDGGYSWNTIRYPEAAHRSGDPIVAYGRTGTGYFVTLATMEDGERTMLVFRSEDGGVTWGKPAKLPIHDHPQIVVDYTKGRFGGSVYINAMHAVANGEGKWTDYHIDVFRSTDDGRTWIGPKEVVNNHDRRDRGFNAMNPALFTDGELFIPFVDLDVSLNVPVQDRDDVNFWYARSKDGGVTFSSPQKFTLQGGGEISGVPGRFPFFAIDTSTGPFRNRIYIAWLDRTSQPDWRSARILVSYSTDRGRTWAKPSLIAANGIDGSIALHVNNEGTVAVSWYDMRNPTAESSSEGVHRYITASVDGGNTWLPGVQVSCVPTFPNGIQRNLVGAEALGGLVYFLAGDRGHGEYLGLSSDMFGTFHVLWTDGRTGSNQAWAARVRVERSGVTGLTRSTDVLPLRESDVTDQVEAYLDPLREFPAAGTVELPIRIKNKSQQPIYGPMKVEVISLTGSRYNREDKDYFPLQGGLLNADNSKLGVGAVFDYTRSLGDFGLLPAGAISEGIVWRFKAPANANEFPRFKFKVTARVERPKEAIPAPKP